jgi:hypothetical protein
MSRSLTATVIALALLLSALPHGQSVSVLGRLVPATGGTLPGTPTAVSPTNGATNISTSTTTLTCASTGATTFSLSGDFGNQGPQGSGTFTITGPLMASHLYTWTCTGINGSGSTPATFTFTTAASGSTTTPQQGDFTLANVFDIPPLGSSSNNINGVTVRYVGGVRHFLVMSACFAGQGGTGCNLYEIVDPGGSHTSSPYPVASFPAWGGDYSSAMHIPLAVLTHNADSNGQILTNASGNGTGAACCGNTWNLFSITGTLTSGSINFLGGGSACTVGDLSNNMAQVTSTTHTGTFMGFCSGSINVSMTSVVGSVSVHGYSYLADVTGAYWDPQGNGGNGLGYLGFWSDYGGSDVDYAFNEFTINEATHSINQYGCLSFNFTNVPSGATIGVQRLANAGITAIDPTFATANSIGRLAAGFGGWGGQSALSGHVGSDGTTMSAFTPPTATNICSDTLTQINARVILGYGEGCAGCEAANGDVSSGPWNAPTPMHRTQLSYHDSFNGWNPNAGIGYFTRTGAALQTCAWVYTTNVSGPVCVYLMPDGYYEGTIQSSSIGTMTVNTTTGISPDTRTVAPGELLAIPTNDPSSCQSYCLAPILTVSGNTITYGTSGGTVGNCGSVAPAVGSKVLGYGTDYCAATIISLRSWHRWFSFNNSDIASVIAGSSKIYDPQPAFEWQGTFDGFPEPGPGFGVDHSQSANTWVMFDPTAKQYIVTVDHAGSWGPRLYVYNVR